MIEIKLYWWMIPGFLFTFPFFYMYFRKYEGDWDFQIDTMVVTVMCWAVTIGLLLGRWLS